MKTYINLGVGTLNPDAGAAYISKLILLDEVYTLLIVIEEKFDSD